MTLLIDTHIWLWYAFDDKRLSKSHKVLLEASSSLTASVASVWEIAMLTHTGRLQLDYNPRIWIAMTCEKMQIKIVPLTADIALESYALPGEFHGDPADRMIVATARHMGLKLLTRDKAILRYADNGHLSIVQ